MSLCKLPPSTEFTDASRSSPLPLLLEISVIVARAAPSFLKTLNFFWLIITAAVRPTFFRAVIPAALLNRIVHEPDRTSPGGPSSACFQIDFNWGEFLINAPYYPNIHNK